ncbi:hypothetical protein OIV83_004677 [Microbotryomycetes sp. JL201]|nr:hypothetical protein OIV83_004677 [Microbotryomycetes sp. JL201]
MAEQVTYVQGDKVLVKEGNKTISQKDYTHVITGYKATLSRAGISDEARQHAQEMIDMLEESHRNSVGNKEATQEHHDQHYKNVVRGLKASLHNPHVSEEAKQSVRDRLEEMGEDVPE